MINVRTTEKPDYLGLHSSDVIADALHDLYRERLGRVMVSDKARAYCPIEVITKALEAHMKGEWNKTCRGERRKRNEAVWSRDEEGTIYTRWVVPDTNRQHRFHIYTNTVMGNTFIYYKGEYDRANKRYIPLANFSEL